MMTVPIRTCLWFVEGGLKAAEFYVTLLPDSRVEGTFAPAPGAPPLLVDFTLGGAPFQILNGGPYQTHSEAASIVITTGDQADTDRVWNALIADGGSESRCGWCKDRWGVSWQVVPRRAQELMLHEDPLAAGRVMQALMAMAKISVADLEAAAAGAS
jgi:predicted 3-demethylubiquinone-9 3-methyltransferase (glyoxalase superfamily)